MGVYKKCTIFINEYDKNESLFFIERDKIDFVLAPDSIYLKFYYSG